MNPYPQTLSEDEWYELSGHEMLVRMHLAGAAQPNAPQAYIPSPRTRELVRTVGARMTQEREALALAARSYTRSVDDFSPKRSAALPGGDELIGREPVMIGAGTSLGSHLVHHPATLALNNGGRAFVVPERHALIVPDDQMTPDDVILTTHVYSCSITSGVMTGADGRLLHFFAHTDAFGGHTLNWLKNLVLSGKVTAFKLRVLADRRMGPEMNRSLSAFNEELQADRRGAGRELPV